MALLVPPQNIESRGVQHGSQTLEGSPTDTSSGSRKDTNELAVLLLCVGNVTFRDCCSTNHFAFEDETTRAVEL